MTEAAADAPPCHSDRQGAKQHAPAPSDTANLFGCPGCADCNIAIVQAVSSVADAALAAGASEIPHTALSEQYVTQAFTPLAMKTGPPGATPGLLSTPITLKQRLLI